MTPRTISQDDIETSDHVITGEIEVEAPSWMTIAVAYAAGSVVIYATWFGNLFGG